MLKNEYTLNVDLKRRLTSTVPTFRQGDNAVLRFKVYDNGKLFDLSTYTSSEITFVLPSGAQIIGNLDLVNGELVYNFTRPEMAEIGKIETFLSITSGSTTVSVQPFYCFIFGTMNSENLSYIGILQELIKETQDLGLSIQGITTQVAETLQLVESELANLESLVATITADELDRTNAENARIESESIRVSNENERVNQETNRFNQESNRVSSESQRVSAENIRVASELTREQNEIVRQETLNNLKSFNYSSVQSYVFPNTVLYNGSTFLALKNNTGITPTNDGVNWRLVAQRGVDGLGAVASVNGILPDLDGDVVLQDLLDHERNLTENLHVEVYSQLPTDLSESGIIIKTDGAIATAGITPTLDQFEDDVREILNEFRDENTQFTQQFTQRLVQNEDKISGIVNAKQFGVSPSATQGNSASLQALINQVRQEVIDSNFTKQPYVNLESGLYILDQEIKMSPFLKFKTLGTVIFKVTHNGTGIHIVANPNDPTFPHTSSSEVPFHLQKNSWNRGKYFEGNFVFISDLDYLDQSINTIAVEIGSRDNTLGALRPTSRYTIEQLNVYGFAIALKLNTFDNYIATFKNCHLERLRHAITWGVNGVIGVNSGEKIIFKDCVIAGCSNEAVQLNAGLDITFENTSFDFNYSPIFKLTSSGVGLRLSNSYVEEIDGTEQLLVEITPAREGSSTGRSSIVIDSVQMLLRRTMKMFKNNIYTPNSRRMNVAMSINALEVRTIGESRNAIPFSDVFFIPTDENFILSNKDLIPISDQSGILTRAINIAQNGDFSKSTVGQTLTSSSDSYWTAFYTPNLTPRFAQNGVGGGKSLDVEITDNSETRYIRISGKQKLQAKAGQIVTVMPSVKIASADNTFAIECRVVCYDESDNIISNPIFYGYLTSQTTAQTFTDYCYPRLTPKIVLPEGTVKIIPEVVLVNTAGKNHTSYKINDIFVSIGG